MAARKTVTVLFCDLVDSTELAERLDAERLRDLLGRWYEAMREPIERHGGTVEKFIGDAVMAVFGVPHVHEDDALRAVRAAVEMRAGVERLNEELAGPRHRPLQVRIGVHTGEVVTGDADTTLVSGDAVNTAKRLEQAAPRDEILIGATTRRLVENAVELEAFEAVAAKGKREPVEAWRVLGTIQGADAVPRRLDAPLVGRVSELAALRDALAVVERERVCRMVTVLGPAGIGKSRLAAALAADVPATLTARCLPYGDGVSLLPLADLVRSAGGDDAVARAVEAEPDGELIAARLCDRAGSPEELQWAVRRLLETLARDRPLAVVVEDVHWAQPAFLDQLEYVAACARDASILIVCLARPDLLELRPHWPGAALTLAPLGDDESRQLLDELGAEWPLSTEARAQVLAVAEGNPLFVEQMVAMLAERGVVDAVPPTIQALLAARLDALDAVERAVLERAAVIGREFTRGAVADLLPGDARGGIGSALLALVRKDLIAPAPSTELGDDGFRFRHALIRDATYVGISKSVRADLHAAVGERIAARRGDDEIVGYHLEQATQLRADLGRRDDASAVRAGELLRAAGLRASSRGDAAAAVGLLRRSLALLPPTDPRRPEILHALSTALWSSGDPDAAELTLGDAIETARAAGDRRVEWYGRLDRAARDAVSSGDTHALLRIAERGIDVFTELADELGLTRAWRRIGLIAMNERRYADAAAAYERALAHAQRTEDGQEVARVADALCSALLYGPAEVDVALQRMEAIADSAGANTVLRAHAATSIGGVLAMKGDFERARTQLSEAHDVYESLGLTLACAGWAQVAASVELLAGEPDAAIARLQESYELLDLGGFDGYRTQVASMLAFLLASHGEPEVARRFSRVGETGRLFVDTEAQLRAAQALLVALPTDAERLARQAVELAETTDDVNLRASMHITLARVTGDASELAAALSLYAAKGNTAAVGLVRAAERDIVAHI